MLKTFKHRNDLRAHQCKMITIGRLSEFTYIILCWRSQYSIWHFSQCITAPCMVLRLIGQNLPFFYHINENISLRIKHTLIKEISPGCSLEGLMLRLKLQYFGHLMQSWLTGKDCDAGRDWGQQEKGMTESEMTGWHHRLNGCESGWTPGVGDGQGGLACCDSWGRKESDTTERLNWTELKEPLDESERGEWKSWLKAQHKKQRLWHLVPSLHGK